MGLQEIIVLIVVVGGIIGSIMEKVGKQKPSGPKSDADEIARRRRRQLEELSGEAPTDAAAAPENLRVGEFEERQRARAAYEARVAEMRPQQTDGMDDERAHMAQKQHQQQTSDNQRRQQLDALSNRPSKKRRRSRQAAPPPMPVETEPAQPHLAPLGDAVAGRRLGSLDLGRGVTEVDTYHVPGDQTMEHVHRHVPDAPVLDAAAAGAKPGKSRLLAAMQGRSWRDLMLLKEVLDPPLSERRE